MEVTVSEFAKRPSKYIKRAVSGLSVVITVRGVQIVKLVPIEPSSSDQLTRLRKLSGVRAGNGKAIRLHPAKRVAGPSIADILDEERR